MFTSIAPRYDLANHVLSLNIDRLWWRRTAGAFSHILVKPQARVLATARGIECVVVDYDELRGIEPDEQRLF